MIIDHKAQTWMPQVHRVQLLLGKSHGAQHCSFALLLHSHHRISQFWHLRFQVHQSVCPHYAAVDTVLAAVLDQEKEARVQGGADRPNFVQPPPGQCLPTWNICWSWQIQEDRTHSLNIKTSSPLCIEFVKLFRSNQSC